MPVAIAFANNVPELIANLDLHPVQEKVQREKSWTAERAIEAVEGYKQFLALMLLYPRYPLVPSEDIDEIWHVHLLWSTQYFRDCKRIFGRYQHHFPCFDLTDDQADKHLHNRSKTAALFEIHFGSVPRSYTYGAKFNSGSCSCYREFDK